MFYKLIYNDACNCHPEWNEEGYFNRFENLEKRITFLIDNHKYIASNFDYVECRFSDGLQ